MCEPTWRVLTEVNLSLSVRGQPRACRVTGDWKHFTRHNVGVCVSVTCEVTVRLIMRGQKAQSRVLNVR